LEEIGNEMEKSEYRPELSGNLEGMWISAGGVV